MDVCLYPPDSMTGFVWNQNSIIYRIAIVSRGKPQRISPIQLEILLRTSVQTGYGLQTMIAKDEIIDFYLVILLSFNTYDLQLYKSYEVGFTRFIISSLALNIFIVSQALIKCFKKCQ